MKCIVYEMARYNYKKIIIYIKSQEIIFYRQANRFLSTKLSYKLLDELHIKNEKVSEMKFDFGFQSSNYRSSMAIKVVEKYIITYRTKFQSELFVNQNVWRIVVKMFYFVLLVIVLSFKLFFLITYFLWRSFLSMYSSH